MAVTAAWLSTGCGLKGPLYRPGERQQSVEQPAAPGAKSPMSDRRPAPQSQKNDAATAPASSAPVVDPDRPAQPPNPAAPATP